MKQNTMFADLIAEYTHYKNRSFLEQLLRVSNTMFAVFTYWNLVRDWLLSQSNFSVNFAVAMIACATVSGIVFGALLLIKPRLGTHLIIFPFVLIACASTIHERLVLRLCIVPASALISLTLIRIIIFSANKINRLR